MREIRQLRRVVCQGFLFALLTSPAFGQSTFDDTALDEIIVIAHKTPREIQNIAASVTSLSSADVSATLSISLADMLRYTPGVDHESGSSRFGAEGINIRGIGGNRVAMLLDGVPLSDQFDIGSFSNATRDFVNAGLIDRVEILHGPASALYGSAAIGGVISVRTPSPATYLLNRGSAGEFTGLYRGADSSLHSIGLVALGDQARGVLLAGSLRDGEQTDAAGINASLDQRRYARRSLLAKWVADDRFDGTWRVGLIHQASDVQSSLTSMLGSGRFRSTTALRGDDEYSTDIVNVAYEFGDSEARYGAGVVRAYYLESEADQTTLDERGLASRPVSINRDFLFQQDISGIELNLQKSISGSTLQHELGFGIEYRERKTTELRNAIETSLEDGAQTNVLLGEVFPLRDFPISQSREWGAYVEDAMSIADWTVVAALRSDSYSLSPKSDTIYREDFPFATPVSLSESDVSPKLGLIYHFADSAEVYLQYTHGFRAPPYEDANIGLDVPLFNIRAIPNAELRSENSDGFDIGFRWRGERSNVRLSMFRTEYSDFIETKRRIGIDPVSGRLLFQSQNLASTMIKGVEGAWRYRFDGALQPFAVDGSFYIARGENKANGIALNSVGPSQLVAGVDWSPESRRLSARLQVTATERWSRRDETAGELFKPPGHALVDFFLTRNFADQLTARIGVMNLADRVYWRWSDVRGLSPSDPVIPYLAQAGRSISVSINKRWQYLDELLKGPSYEYSRNPFQQAFARIGSVRTFDSMF